MGVELESFVNKDNTIKIGAKVLNCNVDLNIRYTRVIATITYNLAFFTFYDIFIVIDPETGFTPNPLQF